MAMRICELDTPALLVDLDAMESNLDRMATFFRDKSAKLRPHFKNHKVPALARRQLDAGAVGITCATLREAEVLIDHGIDGILIANEIAGGNKIRQFAELSHRADVIVAVDNERVVAELAEIGRHGGQALSILVDINVGLNRCGVPSGESACRLACSAVEKGLRFRGLMGYEGHLQALPPSDERDERVRGVARSLVASRELIEREGIPVEIVSTGGSGTYFVSGVISGITEIQAGSYLLMDTQYLDRSSIFTRSLTILATVISRPEPHRAVIDCGLKELSAERGLSQVKGLDCAELKALHAEHGLIELGNPTRRVDLGEKIELWVHYSDATVNLHQRMYGVRNGRVETVFSIEH
jgi:D-serine deaminase-like pyridoxal phosphate-dependent protein